MCAHDDEIGVQFFRGLDDHVTSVAGTQQRLPDVRELALAVGELVHRRLVVAQHRVDHRAREGDPKLGNAQGRNANDVEQVHRRIELRRELARVVERLLGSFAEIGGNEDGGGEHAALHFHEPGQSPRWAAVRYTYRMSRFAVREAELGDAEGIARAHTASWRTSYRGILPDNVLARIDVGQREDSRRRILRDRSIFQLVAYDVTHGDVVGLCDAGPSRRAVALVPDGDDPRCAEGEIYALYLEHHAKRHGLGQEMLERTQGWFAGQGVRSMVIWVLENNAHARGFYEAMGGRLGPTFRSSVGGYPVTERSYVWDRF